MGHFLLPLPRQAGGAASDSAVYGVNPSAKKFAIRGAYWVSDTTTALDATNTLTVAVKNGSTTLFSVSNAAQALTAGDAYEMTKASATGTLFEFSEGDEIDGVGTNAASGKAHGGHIVLECEWIR